MLDKVSKCVINFLDSQPDNQYDYYDDELLPPLLQNETVFRSAIRYLEKQGLVEIMTSVNGTDFGVQLSHTGSHRKEFFRISMLEYFKKNWIAIAALILSIVSLAFSLTSQVRQQSEPQEIPSALSSQAE